MVDINGIHVLTAPNGVSRCSQGYVMVIGLMHAYPLCLPICFGTYTNTRNTGGSMRATILT